MPTLQAPGAPAPHRQADWPAALLAGLLAGIIFLLLNVLLCRQLLANPWLPVQLPAALVLGVEALPPAPVEGFLVPVAGLVIHLLLAIGFTCLIAFCLHRWGILVGLVGGALFGLCLYSINYYFVADFVSGFVALRGWLMLASHCVFGAVAGGLYEFLERDHR